MIERLSPRLDGNAAARRRHDEAALYKLQRYGPFSGRMRTSTITGRRGMQFRLHDLHTGQLDISSISARRRNATSMRPPNAFRPEQKCRKLEKDQEGAGLTFTMPAARADVRQIALPALCSRLLARVRATWAESIRRRTLLALQGFRESSLLYAYGRQRHSASMPELARSAGDSPYLSPRPRAWRQATFWLRDIYDDFRVA